MPVVSILINIASSILYELLESSLSELSEHPALWKAISRTDAEFKDIEGVADHLEEWVKQEETRTALGAVLEGQKEQIDIADLSEIFVKKTDFYQDHDINEQAADIIQTFLGYFLEEMLKSQDGPLLQYKQGEKTQELIKTLGGDVGDIKNILAGLVYALMTHDQWSKMLPENRKLLEERGVKLALVESYQEVPMLMGYQEMHFTVSFVSDKRDQWRIELDGSERVVDVPWKGKSDFGLSLMEFARMGDKRIVADKDRMELHSYAVKLGDALGAALLTDEDQQRIRNTIGQSGPPPLVIVESGDDLILSLPWELIRMDKEFAVREGRIDLARSAVSPAENPPTLPPPDSYMKLVVNVSAPQGPSVGHLDCEAESYRIALALHNYSEIIFTELGTEDDMVNAVVQHEPVGVHFSGHGEPGTLLFEDDDGMEDPVKIGDLIGDIRKKHEGKFPQFFYLASCHGNTAANVEGDEAGSIISAAQLHREGVVQVIGYYGPIVEELSTMAEVAIYRQLAAGRSTRHGVRQARAALAQGPDALGKGMAAAFPFAWAQLVFYHRGPDQPLSLPLPKQYAQEQEARLERSFQGTDERRILSTGFIGRRRELHRFRRACKDGQRVFVFQGLGGLGKSTLAFRALPMLAPECPTLTIWCHEMEDAENQVQELTNRLSEFGRSLFGLRWVDIVSTVDRIARATEAQRFGSFLQAILALLELQGQGKEGTGLPNRVVIYLDNMESLLTGPEDEDPDTFGTWRSPEVGEIWSILKGMSGGRLSVVASCRYRNDSFRDDIIHVPVMTDSAIFRMMGWFSGLRRLSVVNRAKLVARLNGHPRAVEFLDDLISHALRDWEDKHGEWVTPTAEDGIKREWDELIAPALPQMEDRLKQNLLLEEIWNSVLDDRCRRMLFRMTLLRRPWDWELMMQLGDPEPEKTAQKLRETSLVGQVQERRGDTWVRLFQVHPTTARFIAAQFEEKEAGELRQDTYRRVGTYLEKLAKTSPDIRFHMDAGHYLFQCGEFDRAIELLGLASEYLRNRGMVRQGMAILEPFEQPEVMKRMKPELCGQMLGTLGLAYHSLGQVEKSIEYYQQVLEISKEIGDRKSEGAALGNLGRAYADLGQVEKAIEYYQQALEIFKEVGDRRGEGQGLGSLGNAYYILGQVEKAIEHYQQALDIARQIGDRRNEGNWRGSLGNAYFNLGQVEKAIEYYQQVLEISKEIGNRKSEGTALGNLGNAYYSLGQVEKSIEYRQQALDIARQIGNRSGEGHCLANLGVDYSNLGQMEKARECLEAALTIAQEIKDPRLEAFARRKLEEL